MLEVGLEMGGTDCIRKLGRIGSNLALILC